LVEKSFINFCHGTRPCAVPYWSAIARLISSGELAYFGTEMCSVRSFPAAPAPKSFQNHETGEDDFSVGVNAKESFTRVSALSTDSGK